ncbi:MAG: murein biosynthesis integral membrane protein MurJ [Acidobacteria bacterium]|nr:murein biosynthesis integral membrane protein MurJ [Acidobacteriota bacterium]
METVSQPRKSFFARSSAAAVAAGILLSRLLGLVRESVFAYFFGNSDVADALRAALRIPNLLQNLFGEGVLSASFIPVYARLRAKEEHEDASQLAEAVFAVLCLAVSVFTLVGILATPLLIHLIAPGFHGAKREFTIQLVRIVFPGAALLVLSAWCLGILNSHRKFFLSYVAPVVWNLTMIAAYFWRGSRVPQARLAIIIAIASVIGSLGTFLVQLPAVLGFLRPLKLHFKLAGSHLHSVIKNFFPVFISRGVVQISAYVDFMLASYLSTGAVSALSYAQTINSLPVSLFGMAISAAELPAMSSILGTHDEIAAVLRQRLAAGLQNIAYFVIPSAVGFVILGDVIVSTIYRSGHFTAADVTYVWSVLAGSGVGLLASTSGRLYSSAFYSMHDTRTPLRFAILRVALTIALGYFCALHLPRRLHIDQHWGVAGLTLSAGVAGWIEFSLLRHALHARIGVVPSSAKRTVLLWATAIFAAAIAFGAKHIIPLHRPRLLGPCVLIIFAAAYFLASTLLHISAPGGIGKLQRRFRKSA